MPLFKVVVRTKTPTECEVLVAGKDVADAVVVADEGRARWVKILKEVDGTFYAIRAVEVDLHGTEIGDGPWSELVEEPGVYRCGACGGDKIEAPASVNLNTEEIVSYDENVPYWCPDCNDGDGDTHKYICRVDKDGRCTFHNQAFLKCREDAA